MLYFCGDCRENIKSLVSVPKDVDTLKQEVKELREVTIPKDIDSLRQVVEELRDEIRTRLQLHLMHRLLRRPRLFKIRSKP